MNESPAISTLPTDTKLANPGNVCCVVKRTPGDYRAANGVGVDAIGYCHCANNAIGFGRRFKRGSVNVLCRGNRADYSINFGRRFKRGSVNVVCCCHCTDYSINNRNSNGSGFDAFGSARHSGNTNDNGRESNGGRFDVIGCCGLIRQER
jgi:hypothetical protein